ncbi:hypothetical protein [Nakamurella deserti]|uniref:hypothetical protein n=1 Tax=Nakamurella deserti TaxID=2164074 RepID=UPI000DBE5193|nr:hypothetical protein [Nakamurella deserti]
MTGHDGALLRMQPPTTVAAGRGVAVGDRYRADAGPADLDEVPALGGLDRRPSAAAARGT